MKILFWFSMLFGAFGLNYSYAHSGCGTKGCSSNNPSALSTAVDSPSTETITMPPPDTLPTVSSKPPVSMNENIPSVNAIPEVTVAPQVPLQGVSTPISTSPPDTLPVNDSGRAGVLSTEGENVGEPCPRCGKVHSNNFAQSQQPCPRCGKVHGQQVSNPVRPCSRCGKVHGRRTSSVSQDNQSSSRRLPNYGMSRGAYRRAHRGF